MAFFKKFKSKKNFSVFSSSSSSSAACSPNKKSTSFTNANLGINDTLLNGSAIENGRNNSSYVIGDEFNVSKAISANIATSNSQNTSFFTHTKSFISNKLKSNKSKLNSSVNDSFNSATNSNSSPANHSLSTTRSPPSPSHNHAVSSRNLIVYHIDSETEGSFNLTVKDNDLAQCVLDKVCDHYNLNEFKDYFGLKYALVDENGDHEIFWLDPMKTVYHQLKDTKNVLTFRVKHFPSQPALISSEYVRYLIYLQLRNYLLKYDSGACFNTSNTNNNTNYLQLTFSEETKLASYAVQATLGDYDDIPNKENYLDEIKFFPRIKNSQKAVDTITELHKQLSGKTPAEMELTFLEKVSKFDTYGAELIVVKNSKGVPINFGASHNGIITYLQGQALNMSKTGLSSGGGGNGTLKIGIHPWSKIGKISYDGRKLKIETHYEDVKNSEVIKKHAMVFKCKSKRICKHLWKFILDQQAFFHFTRAIDVKPTKSSSSIFSTRSKFRFSGRCEKELLKSQNEYAHTKFLALDASITRPLLPIDTNLADIDTNLNISPISSSSMTSSIITNGSNNTPHCTFKRRSFIKIQHSTLKNNENLLTNGIDTNNNTNDNITLIPPHTTQSSNISNDNDDLYEDVYDEEDERSFKTHKTNEDEIETETLPSKFSETESTNSQSTVIYNKFDINTKSSDHKNNGMIENKHDDTLSNQEKIFIKENGFAQTSTDQLKYPISKSNGVLSDKSLYNHHQEENSNDDDSEDESEGDSEKFFDHDKYEQPSNSNHQNMIKYGRNKSNSNEDLSSSKTSSSSFWKWFLFFIKIILLLVFVTFLIKTISFINSSCYFSYLNSVLLNSNNRKCFSWQRENRLDKDINDPIFYWFSRQNKMQK